MAISVSTDQLLVNNTGGDAESLTNWTTTAAWSTAPVLDGDSYLQGSNAIGGRASGGGTATMFWDHLTTGTANLNLTGTGLHVFFWIKAISLPSHDARVRGGLGISISSGTDVTTLTGTAPWNGIGVSKQWFISGNDFDPTSGWVCYVVDPASTADWTVGSPDMTSVDRIGIRVNMLLAVGAGSFKPHNILWDRVSYGTKLTMTGSTGTFQDIYATDSTTANQFGILTKSNGIFFAAGKLIFGTTGQTSPMVFTDTSQTVVWQDFRVASSFYEIQLVGNTTPNVTTVTLGSYSGGLTANGCIIRGTGLDTQRLIAPVIVSGGTTYVANDILTVVGGTGTVAAQFKVTTVSSGVITGIVMERAGSYSAPPTGTLAVTDARNNSATFTATVVGGSIWTLTASAANQTLNLYGSSFSEMASAALATTTTIRGCTFSNFGTITTNGATIDNTTFQDLRTATPISAVNAVVVSSVTQMSAITSSKFVNAGRAVKITASGTYTFASDTFSGNTFDIENAHTNSTYTSYAASNRSADTTIYAGSAVTAVGQSFSGSGGTLAGIKLYLKRTGTSLTGTLVAKIYAVTGSVGSYTPTGTALATSDTLDPMMIPTTQSLVPLNFSLSNNIDLANATNYFLTLEYSAGDASNNIQVGYDGTATAYANHNYASYNGTSWTADSTKDLCFYVFTGAVIIANKTGTANPATYANTAGIFGTTAISENSACYSFNANTSTYTDESTDINSATVNDVALPPIQNTTAGDIIYFGNDSVFNGVTLNVGTAGNHTGVTINWEYYDGAAWSALTVVETTNSFKTAGTGFISFTPPAGWKVATVNSVVKYWIRARDTRAGASITTNPLGTQGFLGKTTIVSAVGITITVVDSAGVAISGARLRMNKVSDNSEIIAPTSTDGSGQVTGSYNGGGTPTVLIRVRKSSTGSTRYVPFETSQSLPSTGTFTLSITMLTDPFAA